MSFAFLPLYTGDYLRDTQHLSCAEHGIYLKLLIHCWDQKGPAPLDERRLCGIVNARSGDEIEALRRVLGEFFTCMDDGHYNKRMQAEIERASVISQQRKSAGAKGYQAKAKQVLSKSQASAKQVLSKCSARATTLTPTITTTTTTTPSGPKTLVQTSFERFWSAYPKRQAKADALKAWTALRPSDELVESILGALANRCASPDWCKDGGKYVPLPATWLRGKRWEDDPVVITAAYHPMSKAELNEAANLAVVDRFVRGL